MDIVKKVTGWTVVSGSEEHSGWLPLDVIVPPPTPEQSQVLEIKIMANDGDGFLLVWQGADEEIEHDLWFADFPQAEEAARNYFGIRESDW